MRTRAIALLLFTCCSYLVASNCIGGAVERLSKIDTFAFGPVGYAAEDAPGEIQFWVLLGQPGEAALNTFERLYSEGNLQAKSYALVAIRMLNPQRFKELLSQSSATVGKVRIQRGCLISEEGFSTVAREIDRGEYDRYLKQFEIHSKSISPNAEQ